jgi:hypothetical protein
MEPDMRHAVNGAVCPTSYVPLSGVPTRMTSLRTCSKHAMSNSRAVCWCPTQRIDQGQTEQRVMSRRSCCELLRRSDLLREAFPKRVGHPLNHLFCSPKKRIMHDTMNLTQQAPSSLHRLLRMATLSGDTNLLNASVVPSLIPPPLQITVNSPLSRLATAPFCSPGIAPNFGTVP